MSTTISWFGLSETITLTSHCSENSRGKKFSSDKARTREQRRLFQESSKLISTKKAEATSTCGLYLELRLELVSSLRRPEGRPLILDLEYVANLSLHLGARQLLH